MPNGHGHGHGGIAFGTAGTQYSHGGGFGSMGRADEFGFIGNGAGSGGGQRPGSAGTGAQYRPNTAGSMNVTSSNARPGTTGSMGVGVGVGGSAAAAGLGQPITNDPNDYGFGNGFGTGSGSGAGSGSGVGAGGSSARARPRAGTLPGAQNRLTIVNAVGDEIMEEEDLPSGGRGGGSGRSTSGAGGASGQGQNQSQAQGGRGSKPWLTAEEEKARLYQQAKAEVERVQGGGAVERAGTPPVRFLFLFPLFVLSSLISSRASR